MKVFLPRSRREVIAALMGWGVGYLLLAIVVGGYFLLRARGLQTTNCLQSAPPVTEGAQAWLFRAAANEIRFVYLCVRLVQDGQPVNLLNPHDATVTGSLQYVKKDGSAQHETFATSEDDQGTIRFPLPVWDQVLEGTPVDIEVRIELSSGGAYTTHVQYMPPFTPLVGYP